MKKFLKNPWTIGIGTGLIASVLSTLIFDLIRRVSFLSTIKVVLEFIWKCIISFLSFNIKVWWLLIAIAMLILFLWLIAKYYDAKEKREQLSFLNYTQDCFSGQWWEWTWKKDWNGKYGVDYLHPICNKCKTPLVQKHDYSIDFKCPRCNTKAQCSSSDEKNVKILIYDNVNKEYFSKENQS